MPIIEINGVSVKFPYEEPYQVQRNYMHKVIDSLENSGNAILESPTGNSISNLKIKSSVLINSNKIMSNFKVLEKLFVYCVPLWVGSKREQMKMFDLAMASLYVNPKRDRQPKNCLFRK